MAIGNKIDYYSYIKSAEWRAKADAAKQRAGFRCQVCNRPASEVQLEAHHRTYERLGNEDPSDITVLCRDCHKLFSKSAIGVHSGVDNERQERQLTRTVVLYWALVTVVGFFVWIYLYPAPTPQGARMDTISYISYQLGETGGIYVCAVAPIAGTVLGLILLALQKVWSVLRQAQQPAAHQQNSHPQHILPSPPADVVLSASSKANPLRPNRPRTRKEVEDRVYQARNEVTAADIERFRSEGYKPTLEELYLIAGENITSTYYMYPSGLPATIDQWVDFLVQEEQEAFDSVGHDAGKD